VPASSNANPNNVVGSSGIPVNGNTATGGFAAGGFWVKVTPKTMAGGGVHTLGTADAVNVHVVVDPPANVKPANGAAVIVVTEPPATARFPGARTVAPLK